jgi:hypothetical protein
MHRTWTKRIGSLLGAAALGVSLTANPICGQSSRNIFALSAGPSFYRLPEVGHGTAIVATGTMDWELAPPFRLQTALSLWNESHRVQTGPFEASESSSAILPEIGVTAEVGGAGLQPFIGVGIGAAVSLGQVRSGTALYMAGGTRLRLSNRWAIRSEVRIRTIRPFVGRTVDVLFGVSMPR